MSGSETDRHIEVFRRSRWFLSTPPKLQELLLNAAKVKAVEAGESLYTRGQVPNGIFCVLEGAIGITGIGADGKEMLIAHITPGRWCGEMSLFEDNPRGQGAIAEMPSLIAQIRRDQIEAIVALEPTYWRDFGRLVCRKLGLAMQTIEEMALVPAAMRVPRRLLLIAEGYGDAVVADKIVKVQQDQLAMMLSLSRQTTNQILKDLESHGIIRLSYGSIELLDPARLRQSAGMGKRGRHPSLERQ